MVCGLWTVVCGLVFSGCVHRSLTIASDPPGAALFVNDTRLGPTPHTYDFMWYGWHRIVLEKEGYARLEERVWLESPPYLWIPFDFVMELLPLQIRDARTLSYRLTASAPIPEPTPPPLAPAGEPSSGAE